MTYSHNDPAYFGPVARRARLLQRELEKDIDGAPDGMVVRAIDLQKQAGELERYLRNGGWMRDTEMAPVFAERFTEAPGLRRTRYS